ncbi:hypothetical protein IDJ77_08350 [Mucilaginibacter sp. ZT4R22]|uniref:Uncharacterized protein n=1 Tax=Mucilaginibacter pankratovii TaxID=2772110 RepID=A0ABR7WND7_9SPHI|nr:hypothetical protein [Mucilaginibacter pankratovii]MBD1363820.1 hypothetical protein [Mucilaginibacter pankratovii]
MIKRFFIYNKLGLPVLSIALMLICYQLALKKTLEAWQAHRQLVLQQNETAGLSTEPGYLTRKNLNLNRLIAAYRVDTLNFRNTAITQIALIAQQHGAKLVAVPVNTLVLGDGQVLVNQVRLEGDFFSLLKTAQKLYELPGTGFLRSVSIKKFDAYQANAKSRLYMDVYITALQ